MYFSILIAHREHSYTNQEVIGGGRAHKMTRWMTLPLNANQVNPIARYDNGVLTVSFSKINPDAAPKKIPLMR
jgi:HSP20 family molecular chaperone IbpA